MELSGLDYVDHVQVRDTLSLVFPVVRSYATFIPSFWADWGFLIASNGLDPAGMSPDLLMDRLRTTGAAGVESLAPQLQFYDPDAHVRMFALSKDVKARLNHQTLPGDTPPARAQ
jgi:spermidine synthase